MKISNSLADEALLRELGRRLTGARIARNLTQAALALEAGVSKRTVERVESGEVATQLSSFIRVCRVLGLIDGFELLVPEATPGPIAQLKLATRARRRVRGSRSIDMQTTTVNEPAWTWGGKDAKIRKDTP